MTAQRKLVIRVRKYCINSQMESPVRVLAGAALTGCYCT